MCADSGGHGGQRAPHHGQPGRPQERLRDHRGLPERAGRGPDCPGREPGPRAGGAAAAGRRCAATHPPLIYNPSP